jgi:hypothetical protein
MRAERWVATRHSDQPAVQVRLHLAQRGGAQRVGAICVSTCSNICRQNSACSSIPVGVRSSILCPCTLEFMEMEIPMIRIFTFSIIPSMNSARKERLKTSRIIGTTFGALPLFGKPPDFVDGGFRHDAAWNCYGPYLTLQLAHAYLLIGDVKKMDALLGWCVNAGLRKSRARARLMTAGKSCLVFGTSNIAIRSPKILPKCPTGGGTWATSRMDGVRRV